MGILLTTTIIFGSLAFAAAPAVQEKPKVIVQEIKQVDDAKKLLFPARIQAKVNTTVTADLDCHVKRIVKTLGSEVKKGEVVLYLENIDPAFTYATIPVRAPISGVLSQIEVQTMSKIQKGEKLFTVINLDSLKISAEIPSAEIIQLKAGSAGIFRLSLKDEATYPLRIVGISPLIDPRSGTASAEMEFTLDAKKSVILPKAGMVGQVAFEISSGKIILINENSLSYQEGKPMVRLIDKENKSHRKEVILGDQRESMFVVKSGVSIGDRVVVRSNKSIKDNEEVEIQPNAETPKAQN